MARPESKAIMGYLPIEEKHYDAILSLLAPGNPEQRILDPFAGEGTFLEAAAKAWRLTAYANELDHERARACIARFGPKQAVQCDAERLRASNEAFGVIWCNPPYDHDRSESSESKRVELTMLRHSWKWAQEGGIVLWAIYQQHITEAAAKFLAKHAARVDVWALPGKHQGEYNQVIVVASKGRAADEAALYASILAQKAAPRLLSVQSEALYRIPAAPEIKQFIFSADIVDEVMGAALIEADGAWKTQGFQRYLQIPTVMAQLQPVVAPRPGHMALVLAAGVADGAVIDSHEYGKVALRGKTRRIEQVARVEKEPDSRDPERQITKTTIRLKPATILSLLAADGTVVEMEGDEALLGFIRSNKKAIATYLNQKFEPAYHFDMNGLAKPLGRIRLNGKYPLYPAQKHVIAALTKGLESRKGMLLSGQMGVGKVRRTTA